MPQGGGIHTIKTSPEVIRLAVMLYVRFPLSLRNVERELLKAHLRRAFPSGVSKWIPEQVALLYFLQVLISRPRLTPATGF
jgi:hypothetical protein